MRYGVTDLRWAQADELEPLAAMWHAAWRDGHIGHVPDILVEQRTQAAFLTRAKDKLPVLRVAGPVGDPQGLCIVEGDMLYQLFVAATARGTGVAARLLEDAEARMRTAGVASAWLKCAVGNARAAAFYRRHGWHVARTEETLFGQELGAGVPVRTWVFEKDL